MDPKFQSSFIPKGPITSAAPGVMMRPQTRETSILAFSSLIIFAISVILAAGVFGYKLYLKYSIDRMGTDLETARASLEPDVIRELTNLDNRIIAAQELIEGHQILSPLFEFLGTSTPRTVRFSEFNYSVAEGGIDLSLRGEARGYAALALQADIFSRSQYFKSPVFSDLSLNERGDVSFSFRATVDPSAVSYRRKVEVLNIVPAPVTGTTVATGTSATSSPQTATSTQN